MGPLSLFGFSSVLFFFHFAVRSWFCYVSDTEDVYEVTRYCGKETNPLRAIKCPTILCIPIPTPSRLPAPKISDGKNSTNHPNQL